MDLFVSYDPRFFVGYLISGPFSGPWTLLITHDFVCVCKLIQTYVSKASVQPWKMINQSG